MTNFDESSNEKRKDRLFIYEMIVILVLAFIILNLGIIYQRKSELPRYWVLSDPASLGWPGHNEATLKGAFYTDEILAIG